MDRYERLLKLHRILKVARLPVPLLRLQDDLECSRATVYRDVAFLRDGLGAPIDSGYPAQPPALLRFLDKHRKKDPVKDKESLAEYWERGRRETMERRRRHEEVVDDTESAQAPRRKAK